MHSQSASTCNHYMCVPCIISSCEAGNILSCSCNNSPIAVHQLRAPCVVVMKLFNSLLVRCMSQCGQVMEMKHLKQHLESNCAHIQILSPSKITVDHILHTPDNSTPSQMEVQTTGLLVEKLMPVKGPIRYRSTSGKVSIIIYIIIVTTWPLLGTFC